MSAPALPSDAARSLRDLRGRDRARYLDYLKALHSMGWSMTSLARAIGVSRQAVDYAVHAAPLFGYIPWDLPMPRPPVAVPPLPRPVHAPVEPDEDDLRALRYLQPYARTVNGSTLSTDPRRQIAGVYVDLLQRQVRRGVTPHRLARLLGVSHLAITSRLARYGHRAPVPSMRDHAIRGHAVHEER